MLRPLKTRINHASLFSQIGMRNFEVAKVLREIGIFLDLDYVQFNPCAYELLGMLNTPIASVA